MQISSSLILDIDPSRRITGLLDEKSIKVDAVPFPAVPSSITKSISQPKSSFTDCAFGILGSPCRLALVPVMGAPSCFDILLGIQ